jgi:hypothetical protein
MAEWLKRQKNILPARIETIVPEKGTDEEISALAGDVEVIVCSRLSAETVKAAKRLQAYDMHIFAVKRTPSENLKNQLNLKFLGGPDRLDYLLK